MLTPGMVIIKKSAVGAAAVKIKHKELLAERDELNGKLAENASALRDCAAAARLFGVELDLQPNVRQPDLPGIPTDDARGESIREMTLSLLKEAGERGSRASPIRRAIESRVG